MNDSQPIEASSNKKAAAGKMHDSISTQRAPDKGMTTKINKNALRDFLACLIAWSALIAPAAYATNNNATQLDTTSAASVSDKNSAKENRGYQQRTHQTYALAQKARALVEAKQYEKAKAIYQDACKLDPNANSASMHSDFGVALQNLGDTEGAIGQYNQAIAFNQNSEVPLFNLGVCYLNSGKLAQAKEYFRKVIKDYAHSDRASEAKSLLADIQSQLGNANSDSEQIAESGHDDIFNEAAGTANVTSSPAANSAPDTIAGDPLLIPTSKEEETNLEESNKHRDQTAAAQNGGLIQPSEQPADNQLADDRSDYLKYVTTHGQWRWAQASLPVKVYIAPGTGVRAYKERYREFLTRSFDEWCQASDDKLSWKLVDNETDANIVCTWTSNKDSFKLHKYSEQGETHLDPGPENGNNGRPILSATIQLCTVNLFGIVPLTNNDMISVCRHEAGHSLGLHGHSPHFGDVMYPAKFSAIILPVPVEISMERKLSARDKATISHLYASYPKKLASAK